MPVPGASAYPAIPCSVTRSGAIPSAPRACFFFLGVLDGQGDCMGDDLDGSMKGTRVLGPANAAAILAFSRTAIPVAAEVTASLSVVPVVEGVGVPVEPGSGVEESLGVGSGVGVGEVVGGGEDAGGLLAGGVGVVVGALVGVGLLLPDGEPPRGVHFDDAGEVPGGTPGSPGEP